MSRPTVSDRVAGTATTAFVGYDLAELGYLEEEYFLSGQARSYRLEGERRADGRWTVHPAPGQAYTTRAVVRRPIDPADFNGTVVVEWLNVSGGIDAEADWGAFHRYMLREGMAWVGVSAQRAGIEGGGIVEGFHLKVLAPDRYAGLSHPGDAFSYDIYTQVARLLREGSPLLGPLTAERLIATGHSQSAAFLVTYINAIDQLEPAFDGFFVHGRGASAANLDSWGLLGGPGEERPADLRAAREVMQSRPVLIREDHRVPVMIFQSETDVTKLGSIRARQADGPLVRLWEVAGASHADTYLLGAARLDSGKLPAQKFTELMAPSGEKTGLATGSPMNSGPQQHYVGQAALAGLETWIREGTAPPAAPRLDVMEGTEELAVDELGIARGGIRTPWVDVPVSVLSGRAQADGDVFGFLFGTTGSLDRAVLGGLYPGRRDDYLQKFGASLEAAVEAGFLLAEDGPEIRAVAELCFPTDV